MKCIKMVKMLPRRKHMALLLHVQYVENLTAYFLTTSTRFTLVEKAYKRESEFPVSHQADVDEAA